MKITEEEILARMKGNTLAYDQVVIAGNLPFNVGTPMLIQWIKRLAHPADSPLLSRPIDPSKSILSKFVPAALTVMLQSEVVNVYNSYLLKRSLFRGYALRQIQRIDRDFQFSHKPSHSHV